MPAVPETRPLAGRRPLTAIQRRNRMWGLILISPWLLGVLIFRLAPIVASLVLAFTNFYLIEPKDWQWIGLANFAELFRDTDAWRVLLQTAGLALLVIPVQTGASILLASLLSNKKLKLKNTVRSLFFLPSIVPSAAAMFMFQGFFSPSSGWLNRLLLNPIGLGWLNQLSSRRGGGNFFVIVSLWAIGPGFLIMMSALQGIQTEIHEAAQIDGANWFQHFFRITIPLISPAIFFTIILNLTSLFSGSILLDRGYSTADSLSSYDNYIHHVLFDMMKLGYAASLAWLFFVFVMGLVLFLFVTSKYWVYFPDAE